MRALPAPIRGVSKLATFAAVAFAVGGCTAEVEPLDPCLEGATPELSLLAVGDTGDHPKLFGWMDQFRVVASLMADEHVRRPAAALLFLGDNFYSEGLEPHEAVERIRDNYVTPYCAFVASDGPRWAEVSEDCAIAASERRPIPIYASLGNHDYNTDASPKLQRELVPEFISNWSMPHDLVDVHEIGHGVSLIVADTEALDRGVDPAPLAEALRESRGPWRIFVGHHPVSEKDTTFNRAIESAMRESGARIQLLLAGHDHNLQISEPGPPFPSLVAIAGSGSRLRDVRYETRNRKFVLVEPGFARIDLVGSGDTARLVVSLVQTRGSGADFWSPTRVAACWSVGLDGEVSGAARDAATGR